MRELLERLSCRGMALVTLSILFPPLIYQLHTINTDLRQSTLRQENPINTRYTNNDVIQKTAPQTQSASIAVSSTASNLDFSNLRYHPPNLDANKNLSLPEGERFNLSEQYLRTLGFPIDSESAKLTNHNVENFVFVIAANDKYLHTTMDAIARTQGKFPNHLIYFYDLEPSASQIKAEKIRGLCRVVYRQFDYSRYPAHVRNLHLYSFKPLIVHDLLQDHRGVFWIDSSVRFYSSNFKPIYDQLVLNGGILTFTSTYHNNFQTTHSGMYRYLPMPADRAIALNQREASAVILYRTKAIYNNIIAWWFLCALEHDCMASSHRLQPCGFGKPSDYAGCHRFDQAALNILLANHFRYNPDAYLSKNYVLQIVRYSKHAEQLQVCGVELRKSAEHFANLSRSLPEQVNKHNVPKK